MKTDEEKLAEINDLFDFFLKFQDKFSPQVATKEEAKEGEGRKGVLLIRGPNKFVKVFEVSNGRLIPSTNLDHARTVIAFEGVDVFVTLCQEFLDGNTSAIARAKARGEVRIEGDYAVRDFVVFNDLFAKVGKVLSNYGVKIGG